MANIFNTISLKKPKKNRFNLSHDFKFSCNMGELVPVMCLEAVPGDKFTLGCESMLRFAPMLAPIMHKVDVYTHYFFVPNRILWPDFEKWITNTKVDGVLPASPTIKWKMNGTGADTAFLRLGEYLGLPCEDGLAPTSVEVSALPFAAYQKIYWEYYRDQNLQPSIDNFDEFPPLPNGEVPDFSDLQNFLLTLRNRAWSKDYFTSALPFAQKGDAVQLPLLQQFPDLPVVLNDDNGNEIVGTVTDIPVDNAPTTTAPEGTLYVPTSEIQAESSTINDLRRAFKLQEWLEKAARGGSRYIENILEHFGVRSSDKRLQRPEYITGAKAPVVISEVLNTTGTPDAPQGDMAGHGMSIQNGYNGSYFCEEHGYIIGIMSVIPRAAYQQGVPRHFSKFQDPTQLYWPSFAHLGEQEILQKELYAFGTEEDQNAVFGYTPRYAEYKFHPSRVAGDFKTTLDYWHLGRIFENAPALNDEFIKVDPGNEQALNRIFAVTDASQKLWCHFFNKVDAIRPMPVFGTPSIL